MINFSITTQALSVNQKLHEKRREMEFLATAPDALKTGH